MASTGTSPLCFQWQGGTHGSGVFTNLLAGGGQYSGVTNATFCISNLAAGNAGDYMVVVTNAYGSVTSSVAVLAVLGLNLAYQAAIMSDNPTSYWPLNEAGGTTIYDLAGTNNGTCMNTNGLTLGCSGMTPGQTAIYFTNANSGCIKVPYSSTLNTPQFTAEAWLNMPTFPVSGAGADMNPLTFDVAPTPNGWAFEISYPNGSNPAMKGWLATGSSWTQVSSGTCIQGRWTHYALTYDGTTFTIYTNGVLVGSQSSVYSQPGSGTPLYIGAYNNYGPMPGRFYQGGIQNVAVYASALPANRILTHYRAGALAAPVISARSSGTNVVVTWNYGHLQEASSANGPWSYVTNAVSPYTLGVSNSVMALYFQAVLLP
jgi:hypothetical protein